MEIRPARCSDGEYLYELWYERIVIWSQIDHRFELFITQKSAEWLFSYEKKLYDITSAIFVGIKEDVIVGYIEGKMNPNPMVEMLVLDAHRYHGGLGRALWKALYGWFQNPNHKTTSIKIPSRSLVEQTFWRSLGASEATEAQCGDDEQLSPEWMWMIL